MSPFSSFFLILLVAVIFSQIFTRMKIPWVVSLIIGGIILGPSGLDMFEPDQTIEFLATIGLVFLMFMAGLESRLTSTKGMKKRLVLTSLLIGAVPALTGIAITLAFGYEMETAVLMGIIFMSSAIALLIPQLQSQKIIGTDIGRVLVGSAVTVDALSLVLLSIYLQSVTTSFSPITLLMYGGLVVLIAFIGWLIPKVRWLAFSVRQPVEQDLFEKELRFIVLVLIGFVVLFEVVGLHSIIAAFFAGLVLSGTVKNSLIKAKLHAISYGFLVPVFFVVIGAQTDLSVFGEGFGALFLTVSIVVGLIASKTFSGWLAGRLGEFSNREGVFLGVASMPQLSTSLAVAFLGFGEGLLDQSLLAAIIALSIVTATVAPIVATALGRDIAPQEGVAEKTTDGEEEYAEKST
ncbi:MAG: cation:proton antiporter [Candidatus Campbellbacteria bacterium]|nr:cation:proton antiporter [Candidatus Campbellbacteria bacterium]